MGKEVCVCVYVCVCVCVCVVVVGIVNRNTFLQNSVTWNPG